MKKNALTLLLTLFLSVAVLAGCGGDTSIVTPEVSDTPHASVSVDVDEIPADEETVPEEKPNDQGDLAIDVDDSVERGPDQPQAQSQAPSNSGKKFILSEVPAYSDKPYIAVNGNIPYFDTATLSAISMESYSPKDELNRCGIAYGCIGKDLMPTEERGSIGQVKPSGWHTVKYDCVDGKYLYNRCHLIGYQLSGENANEENLITGTRYLNMQGMLPFENMTADYVNETGNHVAYRVTPVFEGSNLVATGVLMEGYSIEDQGDGVCFCVFAYNVQPGVVIDYADGSSQLAEAEQNPQEQPSDSNAGTQITPPSRPTDEPNSSEPIGTDYIINKSTKKFHYPSCSSVGQMKESNKQFFNGARDTLVAQGYDPCGRCHP